MLTSTHHNTWTEVGTTGSPAGYTGPAQIVEYDPLGRTAWVRLGERGGAVESSEYKIPARVAIALQKPLEAGDVVLVTMGNAETTFVIGLLHPVREAEPASESIAFADGTRLDINRAKGHSDFQLSNAENDFAFSWDPSTKTARVQVKNGDLEFATDAGSIRLTAADEIELQGRSIRLEGRQQIRLSVRGAIGKIASALNLTTQRTTLTSSTLEAKADRTTVDVTEIRTTARRLQAKIIRATLSIGELNVAADQIIQSANDIYSKVANLSQSQAGRMRVLVESTFHLKSRRSHLKSEIDFKVDAEKIHLG